MALVGELQVTTAVTAERAYTLLYSLKTAPSHMSSGPLLTHGSLGPPKSTTQTASRSVQAFLEGSLV